MPKRTYTDEQKTEALALYETHGPTHVEQVLGIPKGTVSEWAVASGVRTRSIETKSAAVQASSIAWEKRRLDMAHEMGAVAEQALEETRDQLDAHATTKAREAATTMAILVDKAQLLTGAATSRQEHTKGSTVDSEIERLTKELAETLAPVDSR